MSTHASNPPVSVVMAVKDGENYLEAAIQSVLAQNYSPLEILAVDGGSTDGTLSIAGRFSAVRTIIQAGTGIADAYNTGIAQAKGDLIAFLSHDDTWTSDKLELQIRALSEEPTVQFVTGKAEFFLEPGCQRPEGVRPELLRGSHVANIMETLLARRRVFETVGPFNTNLSTAEDVDWFARARDLNVRSHVVPNVILKKRIHGNNSSMRVDINNQNLLQAVRQSIKRKQQLAAEKK